MSEQGDQMVTGMCGSCTDLYSGRVNEKGDGPYQVRG